MNRNLTGSNGVVQTDQRQAIPGRSDMVENNAGGYGWKVDKWTQLSRFLILGTEGGTYYMAEKKLLNVNTENLIACIKEDGKKVVETIVDVSVNYRAPKNDYALYALAACTSPKIADVDTRQLAVAALPEVARIGTHLYQFCDFVSQWRGWGKGLKHAVGDWYNKKDTDSLAYQSIKYRQREGYTHADILRLSHPKPGDDPTRKALYAWLTASMFTIPINYAEHFEVSYPNAEIREVFAQNDITLEDTTTLSKKVGSNSYIIHDSNVTYYITKGTEYFTVSKRDENIKWEDLPVQIKAFEAVQKTTTVKEAVFLIREYTLPRESLPTFLLKEKSVWDALLTAGNGMPLTALIRNLGNLGKNGVLVPGAFDDIRYVVDKLINEDYLRKAKIHPFTILTALTTYSKGKGARSDGTWPVVGDIIDALDEAFYKSFNNVVPTNKRHLLGIDISDSMTWHEMHGVPGMVPRVGAAAMAMITYRTEPSTSIVAFSSGKRYTGQKAVFPVNITRTQKLQDVTRTINELPACGTDCALPMIWALEQYKANPKIVYDVFIIYTDNETWAGSIHPKQALDLYRNKVNPKAKVIVVGMEGNEFSIADPTDKGMLDIVGFDTNCPSIISEFALGNI